MTFESIAESSRLMNERASKAKTGEDAVNGFVSRLTRNVVTIGSPVGGFKRSPELERHIARLRTYDQTKGDLIIRVGPEPNDDFNFVFPDTPKELHDLCIAARDAVMLKGDRVAMGVLSHFVLWSLVTGLQKLVVSSDSSKIEYVLETMAKEYEYPLPELKQTVLDLQTRQAHDPFQRPSVTFFVHI